MRASLVSIALLATACTPRGERDPGEIFAATPELLEGLGGVDAISTRGTGRAVSHGGGVVRLKLDDTTVVRIAGEGVACTLDDAIALIVFEGPEAFVLLGGQPPRIAALLRDSKDLRCWPAPSIPRLQEAELPEPLLQVALDPFADFPPRSRAQTTLDLVPESEGLETISLAIDEDAPVLGVTASDGTRLMDWSGSQSCEQHDAAVWARGDEQGVALLVEEKCDDCSQCDHGRYERFVDHHLWWPYAGAPISVFEDRGVLSAGPAENGGELIDQDDTRESWRLGPSLLHHDHGKIETTYNEEICADDDESDCCDRQTISEVTVESWTLESETDPVFTGIVQKHEASRVAFDECKP